MLALAPRRPLARGKARWRFGIGSTPQSKLGHKVDPFTCVGPAERLELGNSLTGPPVSEMPRIPVCHAHVIGIGIESLDATGSQEVPPRAMQGDSDRLSPVPGINREKGCLGGCRVENSVSPHTDDHSVQGGDETVFEGKRWHLGPPDSVEIRGLEDFQHAWPIVFPRPANLYGGIITETVGLLVVVHVQRVRIRRGMKQDQEGVQSLSCVGTPKNRLPRGV